MNLKNPYQTLGLSESAGIDEIKQAYRRLAMRYHPDVNPHDPTAVHKFISVKTAHEILTDPLKKADFYRRRTYTFRSNKNTQRASAPHTHSRTHTRHSQTHTRTEPSYPKPKDSAHWLLKIEYFFFTAPMYYYLLASAAMSFMLSLYNMVSGVTPLAFIYERRVSPVALEAMGFTGRLVILAVVLTVVAAIAKYAVHYLCNEKYRKEGRQTGTSFA